MTSRAPRRRRTLVLAALTTVATLALLAAAFVGAVFAPGVLFMLLLLAIPLTVGLPTTCAALLCVSLWSGPPLWLFALLCAASGFALQAPAMLLLARLRRRPA